MTFKGRTCLYHKTCPKGRIFTDRESYEKALRSGWVDAPWEIGNSAYVPADRKALSSEAPKPKIQAEASPASPQPMKPWQIAQAAKKAKRQAAQGANKWVSNT